MKKIFLTASIALLASCGGGGDSSDDTTAVPAAPPVKILTGYLLGVRGVHYKSCGTQAGETREQGAFDFESRSGGCAIAFSIDDPGTAAAPAVPLGTITIAKSDVGRGYVVTPYDFAKDPLVRSNILRTLAALRFNVSSEVRAKAQKWNIDFTTTDLAHALSVPLAEASVADNTTYTVPDEQPTKDQFKATLRCLNAGVYRVFYSQTGVKDVGNGVLLVPVEGVTTGVLFRTDAGVGGEYSEPYVFTYARFESESDGLDAGLTLQGHSITGGSEFSGQFTPALAFQGWLSITDVHDTSIQGGSVDDVTPLATTRFAGRIGGRGLLAISVLPGNIVRAMYQTETTAYWSPNFDDQATLTGKVEGDTLTADGRVDAVDAFRFEKYHLSGKIDRSSGKPTFTGSLTSAIGSLSYGTATIVGCDQES